MDVATDCELHPGRRTVELFPVVQGASLDQFHIYAQSVSAVQNDVMQARLRTVVCWDADQQQPQPQAAGVAMLDAKRRDSVKCPLVRRPDRSQSCTYIHTPSVSVCACVDSRFSLVAFVPHPAVLATDAPPHPVCIVAEFTPSYK